MGLPKKDRIYKVLDEIESREKKGEAVATKGLSKDAPATDRLKFNLCQSIARFKRVKGYSNKDIALILDIDVSAVSRIIHCHIDRFKVDSLLNYYQMLLISLKSQKALDAFDRQIEHLLDDDDLKFG